MSIRACVYKNCDNHIIGNVHNSDFTIFQFPTDPVRRKEWLKLGEVHPHMPNNQLYMCSKHFDKRFMAVTSRRTILVGAALPFPYEEDEVYKQVVGEEEITHKITSQVKSDVESTNQVGSSNIMDSHSTDSDGSEDDTAANACLNSRGANKTTLNPYILHRKRLLSAEAPVGQPKLKVANNNKIIPAAKGYSTTVKKLEISLPSKSKVESPKEPLKNLCDEDVSTFIFQGEEYVQMTKKNYLEEKSILLNKINNYEKILKLIKSNVNQLDFI